MERNEWLARRIEAAKLIMNRWKKREEGWRKELLENLDEEVGYIETGTEIIEKSICPTWQDAYTWFVNRFGKSYLATITTEKEDVWEIKWEKCREYTTVDTDYAKRTVYATNPSIDLELLKKLDIKLYSRITRTERVTTLDEDLLQQALKENPDIGTTLNKAMVAGDPRVRLTIKSKVEAEV